MSTSRTTAVRAFNPMNGGARIEYTGNSGILQVGHTTRFSLPFAGALTSWKLQADIAGSIDISVWASAVNYPPVIGDNIAGSSPITLSNQIQRTDLVLTGWTKPFVANTNFLLTINACSLIRWAELILNWERA